MTRLLQLPPLRARRKENTRERIIAASLDVFVDKGIDGARIDDLARAAGFTRGAFYSNFSEKEQVFEALFASVTDQLIGMVRASVDDVRARASTTPEPDCTALDARAMLEVFEAIRPFGRQWYLLHSEAVAYSLRHPDSLEGPNQHRTRLRDEIARALDAGMERHGETATIPTAQLAQLVIGIFIDLMVREHLGEDDTSDLAGPTILGVLRAFIRPAAD